MNLKTGESRFFVVCVFFQSQRVQKKHKNGIIHPSCAIHLNNKMQNQTTIFQSVEQSEDFRLKLFNNRLNRQQNGSGIHIENICPIYVLQTKDNKGNDAQLIGELLKASIVSENHNKTKVYIAPRIGTISPWSSKATDILHNCGFAEVTRIEHALCLTFNKPVTIEQIESFHLHDRMMEMIYADFQQLSEIILDEEPNQDEVIHISNNPEKLDEIDKKLGLALSTEEKAYLQQQYQNIGKEPTATELMMFAQANSEHCRHKIFNADWIIDGQKQPKSLFKMIRNTEANTSKPAISAYKDNSAVFVGGKTTRWLVNEEKQYFQQENSADILIKVETHNHPTAISPYPGAATGSGGEIRDEAATGQGSRPKVGLTGFSVSHLKIPNHRQAWEQNTIGKPARIASPLEIMLEAPLGGAAFNNEFGRPNICGYFRNLELNTADYGWRGYHKPIMLAGGLGTINHKLALKNDTQADDYLVVLGGPAMLIGLGGGAASSMASGSSCEDLDFASVQRGNPEMQRRCQEVIDNCWKLESDSPIRSIHDVGAGGLSNAMPELLDDAGLGGELEIRHLQIDTKSMTPMEIWCNESQERYVMSIKPEKITEFRAICARERCPYAILGRAKTAQHLTVTDKHFNNKVVDIPMSLLFGNTPKTTKNINTVAPKLTPFASSAIELADAIEKVLNFPTVASKKYLITIGDRTVSGLVHRDQMVGPWQVPVADCGVSLRDYDGFSGECLSIGEKTPLALIDGAASARMAVCEALMNCAGNNIGDLANIKLSANWMAASGKGREDEVLFNAVKAIGQELCPALEIGIPVGKDSLSMQSQWQDGSIAKKVTAPVSLIISAFANVQDVRKSLTPYFDNSQSKHALYYIDLAQGKKRLGASTLAQVYSQLGEQSPDLEDVQTFKSFWQAMQTAVNNATIAAYHDISDGGLFVALAEMCFASQVGIEVNLDIIAGTPIDVLFNEELGAIVAVEESKQTEFTEIFSELDLYKLGEASKDLSLMLYANDKPIYQDSLQSLEKQWAKTSFLMASLRDNPQTCQQEYDLIGKDTGLSPKVPFDFSKKVIAPYINTSKPKVAILREQGVNGQKEMAMAFYKAGFDVYDVHMQDLLTGKTSLNEFQGMAACGGFSFGDVLGAGTGWANSILFHPDIKKQFADYFADNTKFSLGVCNGCQMLSQLKSIIPGAENFPQFLKNTSEQFEARFSSIAIEDSHSVFFDDMQGAQIPVAIAHGEGRALFADNAVGNIAAKYVDNLGNPTQHYPFNPNGSQHSAAAVCNENGNVMIMMPHPERVFRAVQMSWAAKQWQNNAPWMRMFYNARKFIG
jgi:phosphoribosylformylglycinamidine synthase